jgi:hypothetical protein
MKYHTAFVWTLGLAVGSFAGAGYASHGIRVDETISCANVAISSGNPYVSLIGTGLTTNAVRSGFNFPVLICKDSVAGDSNVTSLLIPAKKQPNLYMGRPVVCVSPSSLTGPATDPNTPPLSSFQA